MVRLSLVALLAGLALVTAAPASARQTIDVIPLPTGFQPEGIATKGDTVYTGSLATGAIWRGSVRTGQGSLLVQAQTGRKALGMKVSDGRLWVAGGDTGQAYVYDAHTGAPLAAYTLATVTAGGPGTFINDVIVTEDAAWFTDSLRAVLYRVPLGDDGAPGAAQDVRTVPLTGDFVLQTGFNANGIEATSDGRWLVIVQTNTGQLFRVDASNGVTNRIELTGGDVMAGDGLLLDERTLYVVQNQFNRVAVVKLDRDITSGTITGTTTDPRLDVPTTIAEAKDRLWVVNARFGKVPDANTATYSIVGLPQAQGDDVDNDDDHGDHGRHGGGGGDDDHHGDGHHGDGHKGDHHGDRHHGDGDDD
jgi:outer membrane protein assembly factor BamB